VYNKLKYFIKENKNMKCHNHPEKDATGACVGCGKLFCADCMIEMHGKNYCHKCVQALMDEKDKAIEKAENKTPNVFMNAGGASSSSSSSASSGGGARNAPPYPRNSVLAHVLLFLFTYGIGNIIYFLYIRGRQKDWDSQYGNK
jgi:hypothetical protein